MPRARLYNIDRSFLCLPPAGGSGAERVMDRHATSPSVWTRRALQAECDDLEVIGLAHLYSALWREQLLPAIMDIRAHPISF